MSDGFTADVVWKKPYWPNAQKALKATLECVAKGLYLECEAIMTVSKADYVPVAIGTLQGSGFVELPKITGTRVTVAMGYGGAAKLYALKVHERTDIPHKHGQAKFLEKPTMLALPKMAQRIVTKYRGEIEGSV